MPHPISNMEAGNSSLTREWPLPAQALLDSFAQAYVLLNEQMCIVAYNPVAERYAAQYFSESPAVGKCFSAFLLPGTSERFQALFTLCWQGQDVNAAPDLQYKMGNEWMHNQMHAVQNAQGKTVAIALNILDITSSKLALRKLRSSEHTFAAIYNSNIDACLYLNTQLELVHFNEAAKQAFEKNMAFPLQYKMSVYQLLPPEMHAHYARLYTKVQAGQVVREEQFFGSLWQLVFIFPVYDHQGLLIGIAQSAKDISERKQAEAIIARQNEKLKQIALRQSHELRRPLSSILGIAQLLLQDPHWAQNKTDLALLAHSAQELDAVVRSIVDMSEKELHPGL